MVSGDSNNTFPVVNFVQLGDQKCGRTRHSQPVNPAIGRTQGGDDPLAFVLLGANQRHDRPVGLRG